MYTAAISKVKSGIQDHSDKKKKRSFYTNVIQSHMVVCMWNMKETPLLLDMPMKKKTKRKIGDAYSI